MPATYTYPGVYVEEVPSGVHPLAGVTTSETAFVDYFPRGPMNRPTRVTSLTEFERTFGSLDANSEASYAIRHYFLNGGSAAWIVRVATGAGTRRRRRRPSRSRMAARTSSRSMPRAKASGARGSR